jgi:hypothetical protein
MAASPTSVGFIPPNVAHLVHVRLDGPNYTTWLSQIRPVLRTNDFMGIVDGSEPCPPEKISDDKGITTLNPAFILWTKKDQFILSLLNSTLTEKVLASLYGMETSRQVWTHLSTRFASESRSHIVYVKRQLQHLHQGS